MKILEKSNITILIIILMAFPTFAQSNVVSGKVTTYKTIAIKSAKVTVKKTKKSTFTDSLGYFKLECNVKDKLIIKAVGFKSRTTKVKNIKDSLKINIEAEGDESDLDLAFANGHINSKELIQAKTYYNTVQPYSFGYNNIIDLLRVKFPNISVSDSGVIIRGSNTISTTTSNDALIVLNGVITNFDALKIINIIEIKSIKILTGPAATRFGSGSSNGVVSVELLSQ